MKNKKNKFGNKKTELKLGGIIRKFDSKAESDRGQTLYLLEKKGQISDLIFQMKFRLLSVDCTKIITEKNYGIDYIKKTEKVDYIADFYYFEKQTKKWIIEDVKSEATAKNKDYIIKRKLLLDLLRKRNRTDAVFREIIGNQIIDWEV